MRKITPQPRQKQKLDEPSSKRVRFYENFVSVIGESPAAGTAELLKAERDDTAFELQRSGVIEMVQNTLVATSSWLESQGGSFNNEDTRAQVITMMRESVADSITTLGVQEAKVPLLMAMVDDEISRLMG